MKKFLAAATVAGAGLGLMAMPAGAHIDQDGLVNVAIEDTDVVVQVPIAVAANVCDVIVIGDTGSECTADADTVNRFRGRR